MPANLRPEPRPADRSASTAVAIERATPRERSVALVAAGVDPEPAWWQALWADGEPLAGATGRGGVRVLRVGARELVARDLRRGGLFAGLLPDVFLDRDRARRELELLAALRGAGVDCVPPVAALARRVGCGWRQRLVTERVHGALPLPAFVARHPGRRAATVTAAARLLAAAFAAGLRHPDLHPENVLAVVERGAVRALLVDLDKARLAPPLPSAARDAMLVRMARFSVKHRARLPATPTRADQLRFLRALGLGRDDARGTFRRLAARLAAQLARRGYASSPSSAR